MCRWGITQILTHFGCCQVRTSSFDLDDLDNAPTAPPESPHTPQQCKPASSSVHRANSWRPLQEVTPPSNTEPAAQQDSPQQAGHKRKVSFNLPQESPAGSPSKANLLQNFLPSHADSPANSDDEDAEDIYATADVSTLAGAYLQLLPKQSNASPFCSDILQHAPTVACKCCSLTSLMIE